MPSRTIGTRIAVLALVALVQPAVASAQTSQPKKAPAPANPNRTVDNAMLFLTEHAGLFSSGGWCGPKQACGEGTTRGISFKGPVTSPGASGCAIRLNFGEEYTASDGKKMYYSAFINFSNIVELQKVSLEGEPTTFLLLSKTGHVYGLRTGAITMVERFTRAFAFLRDSCKDTEQLAF
jgi:hypothetical protein